jgi:8-oxo-dGTP pyrophosphatase MutT (NUDIX family)
MYKVFYNHCRLIISGIEEGEILNNPDGIVFLHDPYQLPEIILPFLGGCNNSLTICGNLNELWNYFQTIFQLVPAAGGVVKSSEGYLFIFRKGKWDLPKGKIDKGESAEDAAVREVKEETGLQEVSIIKPLLSTWHIYYSEFDKPFSKPVLKETKWFLMEAAPEQVLVPETVEDIETARWFSPTELELVLKNTYASLSDMIENLI